VLAHLKNFMIWVGLREPFPDRFVEAINGGNSLIALLDRLGFLGPKLFGLLRNKILGRSHECLPQNHVVPDNSK
jgi:hypothetical protein